MDWDGSITFLGAHDLEKTHRFYHDVLGLPLCKDQGVCRIYTVRPGCHIGFCTHLGAGNSDGLILTFLTQNVDSMHARLTAAIDVQVEDVPAVNPQFNIYHFFARDPDGYRVEIQKFID